MPFTNVIHVHFAQFRSSVRCHVLHYVEFLNIPARLTSIFEGRCRPAGRSFADADLRLLYRALQTICVPM